MSTPTHQSAAVAAPLRVACIGGGPGGLFTAIAVAHAVPGARIDVFERNKATDIFGFGVVFSDATLDNIDRVDPVLRDTLAAQGRHWDTIEVRSKGVTTAAGGNGMAAIHRRVLLDALRQRATALGARLHFATAVDADTLDASGDYDVIVAADGANSRTRERFSDDLEHSADEAAVKFIWFGTTFGFDGLTFLHKQSEHGNFAVHAYPIGSGLSTFIVETDETSWRAAGLDSFDTTQPPGPSDTVTQRYLEQLFATDIDGHPLVANNSRWANFRTRRTRRWHTRGAADTPVVLLGDAVHTAHFSVGSGTKMAMEDAAVLANAIAEHRDDLGSALERFQEIRKPQVAKIQDSSMPSLSWWDHFGQYYRALEPWQFGFHFFSRAISAEKIRVRDPQFIADTEAAWRRHYGSTPLDTPLRVGATTFTTRLLDLTDNSDSSVAFGDRTHSLTAVAPDSLTGTSNGPLLFTAPVVDNTCLDDATRAELDSLCERRPAAIAIRGGTALSRALSSEHVRFTHHVPTILIEGTAAARTRRAVDERDNAATVVLSGRADAVAYESVALNPHVPANYAEASR
ncbi:FAD-dependent monooxygenase [Nocardia gipuzkoensis]|uniref:FAD-dependent monooxygenase n=1 Tax=Nocardia gipuzkoensis TaxID=2749991 RepID=UPI0015EFD7D2|nr:FAD-dependent monooxygenase [Nocardia gipuzkoensis]